MLKFPFFFAIFFLYLEEVPRSGQGVGFLLDRVMLLDIANEIRFDFPLGLDAMKNRRNCDDGQGQDTVKIYYLRLVRGGQTSRRHFQGDNNQNKRAVLCQRLLGSLKKEEEKERKPTRPRRTRDSLTAPQ